LEQERRARLRAKQNYLIAGGMAVAAAALGIVDDGVLAGVPTWLVAIVLALAAAAYVRVARGFLRRDDDETGPSVERMRRMAFIWLALTVVLGVAVVRAPAAAFLEAGAAGLEPRGWAAASIGIALIVAACARAMSSIRGRGAKRESGG
jgi:hypothetical protein